MTWATSSLASGSGYLVQITAYDPLGNSASDTSDASFTINNTPPVVAGGTITSPTSSSIYAGGSSQTITWTSGNITDAYGLGSTPITLAYSVDGGSSWTTIASGLANNGSSTWTVPASTNITNAKIRLTATDIAGNTTSVSTSNFIIDSTAPTVSVSYAGNGGTTPQNGRYINNSGFDISASASDTYLANAQYSLENTSNNTYWNGSSWTGTQAWNTICTDPVTLGTSTTCNSIASSVAISGITQGTGYQLVVRTVDEAGNTTSANPANYTGDVNPPNLSITNTDNSYASTSVAITGTASDPDSGLSSVAVEIKKGSTWWNGSAWVGSQQLLSASGTSSWSYTFSPPSGDADGQSYTVNVYAYDSAFKTNNSTMQTIHLIKDTTGPTIGSSIFTFDTTPYYK